MYAPHTITLYNAYGEDGTTQYNITALRGVLCEEQYGTNANKLGQSDTDSVRLFIPFSVLAVDGNSGNEKQYLPPKQFYDAADKSAYWTIDTGGESCAVGTFFIKGEVVEALNYSALRDKYDGVYDVTSVFVRDFGTADMRHFQVGGR